MKILDETYGSFKLLSTDNSSEADMEIYTTLFNGDLQDTISKCAIAIVLGSGVGMLDVSLCRLNPGICIYSFEPREMSFCLLQNNITRNGIENVIAMHNALGHMNGTARVEGMHKTQDKVDYKEILEVGNGAMIGYNQDVHFVTLDSLNLFACDLIIINLSGFAYIAIYGGIQTIRKFRPTICFKPNSTYSNNMDIFGMTHDVRLLLQAIEYDISETSDGITLAQPMELMHREQIQTFMNMSNELISNVNEVSV